MCRFLVKLFRIVSRLVAVNRKLLARYSEVGLLLLHFLQKLLLLLLCQSCGIAFLSILLATNISLLVIIILNFEF